MKERIGPELWLEANHKRIWDLMKAYKKEYVASYKVSQPDEDLSAFEEVNRKLPEMPLCKVHVEIANQIGLPRVFFPIKGHLSLPFGRAVRREAHTFIIGPGEVIMDFTAAQFQHGENPGSRIRALQKKAPELVRSFPSGLVVLQGKRAEVRRVTGYDYQLEQLQPNKA